VGCLVLEEGEGDGVGVQDGGFAVGVEERLETVLVGWVVGGVGGEGGELEDGGEETDAD
jgi:hypothetical protein